MCGFVAVLEPGNSVASVIYDGLIAAQHRGQDAAGITTYDNTFHVKKGQGLVQDVLEQKHMQRLQGEMGIGHVRYPTMGSNTELDAQPLHLFHPYGIVMAHNGNVANYHRLRKEAQEKYKRHINTGSDLEVILNIFADRLSQFEELTDEAVFAAVAEVFDKAKGAYSVVGMIAGYGLVAFRDPSGIKPFAVGSRQTENGKTWALASESISFGLMGYDHEGDLAAGEAIIIRTDDAANPRRKVLDTMEHTPCIFEHIYFARPDSVMDGMSVNEVRDRQGRAIAEKIRKAGFPIDVVVPVPDSARTAAYSLSKELKVSFSEALVKNRYIGRTFIMPDQEARRSSVRTKLSPIVAEIKDKHVLLLDDSIVRGNTSAQIVEMVRSSGAKSVSFASYSSPIRYPCVYGIDMSRHEEFIAHNKTEDEIRQTIGCDNLVYQDIEVMNQAAQDAGNCANKFCDACFTGNYPAGGIKKEDFESVASDRDRGDNFKISKK
jgi:amidophosphoribosyltransferase